MVGENTGLRMLVLLTPVAGDQVKEVAELVKPGVTDDPEQMETGFGTLIIRSFTVTLKLRTIVQEHDQQYHDRGR